MNAVEDRIPARGSAGVDPGLVRHFHGTRQELFVAVVELPIDPATALPALLTGDRDAMGERLANFLLEVIESDPVGSPIISLARAAAIAPTMQHYLTGPIRTTPTAR